MAKRNGTSFIIRNRLGVYYYQRRIAETYRVKVPSLPVFLRISLRTKERPLAIKIARVVATMWDLRAKEYFQSEEGYNHGSALLRQFLSKSQSHKSFEEISEHFFDLLDDTTCNETELFEKALELYQIRQLDAGIDPFKSSASVHSELLETKLTQLLTDQVTKLFDERLSGLVTQEEVEEPDGRLISDVSEDFIASQRGGWKEKSGMEKSYREVFFPLLIEVIGDLPTNKITKAHIVDFTKVMLVFPSNRNKKKKYKNLSVLDFLDSPPPEKDRIKGNTKKKYFTRIGTFLRWLKTIDMTSIDLSAPITAVKVKKVPDSEQKSIFTAEDLKKLFNSKCYKTGLHKTASQFWVPLIGIYTGARLNEICQLSTADVYLDPDSQRWVFDFNEDDDNLVENKSIKKEFHKRKVPIHKRLLELDFIEYWKLISKKNKRIFPELRYVRDENKYGGAITKWFSRTYTNKLNCDITTPKTSFHSFRHTLITHLATVHGISENQASGGLGQTAKGGVYEVRYTKQLFSVYSKYFDLVNFDDCFDTSLIRNWQHQQFAKKLS
jgi:integrase